MAYNQAVTLTGNLGAEAEIKEGTERSFAAFSLATADSYQDEQEQWVQKESIWHKVLAFSPHVQKQVMSLKKGTRVEITGSISYRPFETSLEDGRMVTKNEAVIIAHKLELKPLAKKQTA